MQTPISAFGGIVAFNQPVDAQTAKLLKEIFLEVIVAPGFTPDALEVMKAKPNVRLVQAPTQTPAQWLQGPQLRHITPGTVLLQHTTAQSAEISVENCQIVTKTKPPQGVWNDLLFGWRVAKHVKSNAMVVVQNGQTLGIGAGQTSRVGALEIALAKAVDGTKGAIIASDGFLPRYR